MFIGALLFILKKPAFQYQQVVKAIPKDAVLILKVNSVKEFFSTLMDNNNFQNLPKNSLKNNIEGTKLFLDSLSEEIPALKSLINDSSIYFSFHNVEDKLDGINIYLPFGNSINKNVLSKKLYLLLEKRGYELIQYSPSLVKFNNLKIKNRQNLYYFFKENLLIIGNRTKNIADAYKQSINSSSLLSDTSFSKVFSTTGKKTIGNLYIESEKFSAFFAGLFQPAYSDDLKKALKYKGWYALDLNIDHKCISLHGFSNVTTQKQIWLRTIKNELPVDVPYYEALPASTVFYGTFALSEPYNYKLAINESMPK